MLLALRETSASNLLFFGFGNWKTLLHRHLILPQMTFRVKVTFFELLLVTQRGGMKWPYLF